MIDFCVLGSGVSGSTIANLLNQKYKVEIFDKARGVGGRSSIKKIKKSIYFDHGLQYYSPKSSEFNKFINLHLKKKVLKVWEGDHLDFTFKKKLETIKIIGNKGNNSLNKFLLKKIKKNLGQEIIGIKFKGSYWELYSKDSKFLTKNLIISFPYNQAKSIAKKYLNKKFLNLNVKMKPNITLLLSHRSSEKIPFSSIKLNDKMISWISNENSKKRYIAESNYWTVQTSLQYSQKIINKYKSRKNYYSSQIKKKFSNILGIKYNKLQTIKIHGWKYSYNFDNTNQDCYWDPKKNIGLCGDWFIGSNAESAWLSANKLFEKIKKNPPNKN